MKTHDFLRREGDGCIEPVVDIPRSHFDSIFENCILFVAIVQPALAFETVLTSDT